MSLTRRLLILDTLKQMHCLNVKAPQIWFIFGEDTKEKVFSYLNITRKNCVFEIVWNNVTYFCYTCLNLITWNQCLKFTTYIISNFPPIFVSAQRNGGDHRHHTDHHHSLLETEIEKRFVWFSVCDWSY